MEEQRFVYGILVFNPSFCFICEEAGERIYEMAGGETDSRTFQSRVRILCKRLVPIVRPPGRFLHPKVQRRRAEFI